MILAYRLLKEQTQPAFQNVPEPHAAPGQVVVKVAGFGLCHTDFTVISRVGKALDEFLEKIG